LVVVVKNASIDLQPVFRELERTATLSNREREVLLVLLLSVVLWVSGASLEKRFGLPHGLLNHAVVALAAVALLSIDELIDWNDLKGVNWGVFFVIGAGLTLGDALDKTGAGLWFANLLAPTLEGLPYIVIVSALVFVGYGVTQFMNNVTLGAIMAPILVELGKASGISPERLVLPTILAIGLSYVLPVASARMTLAAVSGAVARKEMMVTGLVVGIPSALLLVVFFIVSSWFGLI
nr:SLC13 family permease [Caldilineaceae bacterium]